MTKQDEIDKGIAKYIRIHYNASLASSEITSAVILRYLRSQGVFIAKYGFYSDLMEPLIKE